MKQPNDELISQRNGYHHAPSAHSSAPYPTSCGRKFLTHKRTFLILPTTKSKFLSIRAKDGKDQKTFPALEWLAAMCSHIPNRGEQMVRYYGYYSNVARGKRKAKGADYVIPSIIEPEGNSKAFRKNWARLIQKIYEVDPLICPKCKGTMRIISFIEDPQVIRDILTHLGLWLVRSRPPPKICAAISLSESKTSDSCTHPPHPQADAYADPEYSWDDYIQS